MGESSLHKLLTRIDNAKSLDDLRLIAESKEVEETTFGGLALSFKAIVLRFEDIERRLSKLEAR